MVFFVYKSVVSHNRQSWQT